MKKVVTKKELKNFNFDNEWASVIYNYINDSDRSSLDLYYQNSQNFDLLHCVEDIICIYLINRFGADCLLNIEGKKLRETAEIFRITPSVLEWFLRAEYVEKMFSTTISSVSANGGLWIQLGTLETYKKEVAKQKRIAKGFDNKKSAPQMQYILDCIDTEDYTAPTTSEGAISDEMKVKTALEAFDTEYNSPYEKKRTPILQNRIAEWLQGLPSVLSIDYSYYSIVCRGNEWGVLHTEKIGAEYQLYKNDRMGRAEAKFCDNWWGSCALRLLQLADFYGVDYSKLY